MRELGHRGANVVRRKLLAIWESHGGGFYGFVAALTFLYLEAIDISGDIAGLPGTGLDLGSLLGFVIGNMVDAFVNAIHAALWPVSWIDHFGVGLLSGGLLAGSYAVFNVIRPGVVRMLQPTDPAAARTAVTGNSKQVGS